jgi:hypothetical protein
MPKKRKKIRKPYRPSADPRIIALNERREEMGERARQRQWHLDASVGGKIPEHFDYPEIRDDDDSPMSRTERRFLDRVELQTGAEALEHGGGVSEHQGDALEPGRQLAERCGARGAGPGSALTS